VGGPGTVITDTQSYGWVILNAIYDKLVASNFFQNWTLKRLVRALPIEGGIQIPFLGIYWMEEALGPLGDINAGEIRFTDTVRIGFQIVMKNNDPVALQTNLDQAYWFIMNYVLRDPDFTNLFESSMVDNTRINGISRGLVRTRWGLTGSKNETPVGELQMDLSIVFGTEWAPGPFPDLERITVQTGFPQGGSPEEVNMVQQVTMVYDFNPDAVPNPLPPGTDPPNPFYPSPPPPPPLKKGD
jgi:hypothetical protein